MIFKINYISIIILIGGLYTALFIDDLLVYPLFNKHIYIYIYIYLLISIYIYL